MGEDIPLQTEAALLSFSGGGSTGRHFTSSARLVQVASATSDQSNTIRRPLTAIACWRVNDVNFDFDSSFPRPEMRGQMAPLKTVMDRHPEALLSLFGHADPVGNDEYNKALSGRRAQAIFALLTRRTDLWADLFQNNDWGDPAIKTMLAETEGGTGENGEPSPQRISQIKVNPVARQQLFGLYMDRLCVDDKGLPFQLTPERFFGGGADPGGKGDFQGCGEFNPVLMFSQSENAEFEAAQDKQPRNEENAPNRRVVGLLFRPPHVDLGKWPCPRVKETTAGCRKRLWSDHPIRRSFQSERRLAEETHDTFACRFYDRLAGFSPCDRGKPVRVGRLLVQVLDGEGRIALAGREYVITSESGTGPGFQSTLNEEGILQHDQVLPGDYTLAVAGCDETRPLIVLDLDDDVPQVVCLENSRLSIFVRTDEGPPIEGATVEVEGLGQLATDGNGIADFGHVEPGLFRFSSHKDGFVAARGDTVFGLREGGTETGDGEPAKAKGQATVVTRRTVAQAQLKPKQAVKPTRVIKITASLPGTFSVRQPNQKLPPNTLRESTSNSKKLDDSAQPPVILVRGGGEVQLAAETDPPGQPVQWSIEANPAGAAKGLPGLQASPATAVLKTDAVGSFSVIARAGGTEIVWNFVLVAVVVDANQAKVTVRSDYKDLPVNSNLVAALSGEFFKPREGIFDKQAWTAEIPVSLIGGGADGKLGVDKVRLGYLQNMTFSGVVGDYDGGALARRPTDSTLSGKVFLDTPEKPVNAPPSFPTITFTDNDGKTLTTCPLIFSAGMVQRQFTGGIDKLRLIFGDSPGAGFNTRVQQGPGATTQKLTKIRGFIKFRAAVATFSADAVNLIVVHAEAEWLVDYDGRVEYPQGPKFDGKYVKVGAHTTDVNPWKLLASGTNGTGADQVGFEIFPPLAITEDNKPQVNKF